VEVTAAVCGFHGICHMASYLCDKCLLEDTAALSTVGLLGLVIVQYVVIYSIPTVESLVLKLPTY
jgi:hypothetical protein